jgi:hypothetical protein
MASASSIFRKAGHLPAEGPVRGDRTRQLLWAALDGMPSEPADQLILAIVNAR